MTFNQEFGVNLLQAMYDVPSSELSTKQIAEIITEKTGVEATEVTVRELYKRIGFNLRTRQRVVKEPVAKKEPKVSAFKQLVALLPELETEHEEEEDYTEEPEEYEEYYADDEAISNTL